MRLFEVARGFRPEYRIAAWRRGLGADERLVVFNLQVAAAIDFQKLADHLILGFVLFSSAR